MHMGDTPYLAARLWIDTPSSKRPRWSEQGVCAQAPEETQVLAQQSGDLDWAISIGSTIVRVHQHGATLPRIAGVSVELQEVRDGPPDHAIGRSRGGLTTKNHLVCDQTRPPATATPASVSPRHYTGSSAASATRPRPCC